VMDPRALNELIPDWKEKGAPLDVEVTEDRFLFLSETGAKSVPNWALPDNFKNHGNYVISLANVTRWLGQQAEALGVEIFPGFAAAEVLYNDDGSVKGVATGNLGIGKDGEPTENFQLGMELHAKYTLFCEGARGHLGRQLSDKFRLRDGADPQVYRLSSVFISNTNHEENQPAHLTLKDASVPVRVNLQTYAGPEARFCPAGVYEFVKTTENCVHCKTCDIKDPTQNIVWVTPEGGGGPNYSNM